MRRVDIFGTLPLLALVFGCSDSTGSSGSSTDFDIGGDWYWEEAVADTSLGVTCADTGSITVTQNGVTFTATGHITGACIGPGGTAPIDGAIQVTSGKIAGSSVTFSADGCPYRGTAFGAAPDSAHGTISCTASSGGVTIHLKGTWRILRAPPDVQPTVAGDILSRAAAAGVGNGGTEPRLLSLRGHRVAEAISPARLSLW
jgi:hypothetical protein